MTYLIEENRLFTLFNVDSLVDLENSIFSIAPSLCEYYLNDLISYCDSSIYLNKSNIQDTIYIDLFNIYIDYDSSIYIEILKNDDEYSTESLW